METIETVLQKQKRSLPNSHPNHLDYPRLRKYFGIGVGQFLLAFGGAIPMQFENDANGDSVNRTLERFFAGLSEYAFHSQLGVADTELATTSVVCWCDLRRPMLFIGLDNSTVSVLRKWSP